MIFPDIPKRYTWIQHSPELVTTHTQAPLQSVEQTASIDIEQWFKDHGLPYTATDPAATSKNNQGEPIDWLARDAWEFYTLCVLMIVWIGYWLGVHRGVW